MRAYELFLLTFRTRKIWTRMGTTTSREMKTRRTRIRARKRTMMTKKGMGTLKTRIARSEAGTMETLRTEIVITMKTMEFMRTETSTLKTRISTIAPAQPVTMGMTQRMRPEKTTRTKRTSRI